MNHSTTPGTDETARVPETLCYTDMGDYVEITCPSDVRDFLGQVVQIKMELVGENNTRVPREVYASISPTCDLFEGMIVGPLVTTYTSPGALGYVGFLTEEDYKYNRK